MAVWQWIYWTAARRHELVNSKLGSVSVTVHDGRARWRWEVFGKGAKLKQIPLAHEAVAALANAQGCDVLELPTVLRSRSHQPLLSASRGDLRSLGVTQIYESVRRVAAAAAGSVCLEPLEYELIAKSRPHSLRAFRATHLFNAGVDARLVQRFLRHADINTTLIYDHTDAERFHDAIV